MPRFGEDLRAIVGVDKIKKDIQELANKIAIAGKRGVGYQSPDGTTQSASGSAGSGGGVKAPDNSLGATGALAATTAAAEATAGASQTPSVTKGGMGPVIQANIKGSEDGVFDIADIIDNAADSVAAFVGDSLEIFSRNVSAINGWTDPTTGKAGTLRLDDYGAVPPSDWTDANTPGPDATWVAGKYWLFGGAFYGATWGDLIADATAKGFELRSNAATTAPGYYYQNSEAPVVGQDLAAYSIASRVLNGVPSYAGFPYITSGSSGYGPAGTCPAPTGYTCLASAPAATTFPLTDSFQLIRNPLTGKMEGNPYDSEVPFQYRPGSNISTAYHAFGSGRFAVTRLGVNGTTLLYETDASFSLTPLNSNTSIHVYNAKGQRIGIPFAAQLNDYLPN